MDEILIDSIVDLSKVQAEKTQLIKYVNEIDKALNDVLSKQRNPLAGVKGYGDLEKVTHQLAAAVNKLNSVINEGIKVQKGSNDEKAKGSRVKREELSATEAQSKAELENIKNKKEATKYQDLLSKEIEKSNKARIQEEEKLGKLNNAYDQLKSQYTIAANTAKNLAAAKGLDNEETKQAIAVAERYNNQLIKIERSVGQSQRTIGQYERAQFSLNQVLREAPAFANSFTTGIMAISNNVPMLVDEIGKLRAANIELAAAGGKPIPVYKTLFKTLLSGNTLLLAGITILAVYGKEIGNWVTGLIKGEDASLKLSKAQKEMAESVKESTSAIKDQIDALELDRREQLQNLKNQITIAENNGASQTRLFAMKKNLATQEKELADEQLKMGIELANADDINRTNGIRGMEALKNAMWSYKTAYGAAINEEINALKDLDAAKLKGDDTDDLEEKIKNAKSKKDAYKEVYDTYTSILGNATETEQAYNEILADEAKFNADERRKLILETARIQTAEEIAKNDRIISNEKSTQDEIIEALKRNQREKKRIIAAEKGNVVNDPSISSVDKKIAINKAAMEERLLTIDTQQRILDVKEGFRLRDLAAQKDALIIQKKQESDINEELLSDTKLNMAARLEAQKKHSNAEKDIIDADYNFKKEQVKNTHLTEDEKLAIEIDYEDKILNLTIKSNEQITSIIKTELDKRYNLHNENLQRIQRIYNNADLDNTKKYADDVIALNDSFRKKEVSVDEYNKRRKRLDKDFNQSSTANLIKALEDQLAAFIHVEQREFEAKQRVEKLKQDLANATTAEEQKTISIKLDVAEKDYQIAKDTVDKKIDLEKKLNNTKKDLSDQTIKDAQEAARKMEEAWKNLATNVADLLVSIGDGGFERENQEIEAQLDLLSEKTKKEIDGVNQSVSVQADRERQIALINARAAAEQNRLEQQQRANQVKQARFDRDTQALKILGETLFQVAKAGWITPLAILIAAAGLASIGVLYAKPLPRFFKGKDKENKYSGYGFVGDGGQREVILRKDKTIEITPDRPTITYIGRDDIIMPSANDYFMQLAQKQTLKAASSGFISEKSSFDEDRFIAEMKTGFQSVNRTIRNKPETKVEVQGKIKRWMGSEKDWDNFNLNDY